jgi:preprotein translocase SecF subunit
MRLLPRFIPDDTHIPFMSRRFFAVGGSLTAVVVSILLVAILGLNFGIDFRGGTLVEVRTTGPADLGRMRQILGGLDLGEVQLQNFGAENDVLIRFEKQLDDPQAQQQLVEDVQKALREYDPGIEFRRVEYVGPKVSRELLRDGVLAVLLAVFLVLIYIWFRFEWQFGAGAVVALVHDVVITIGAFAVTQYEFNLSTVAALLTIVGYSLNDTVIVYDRIRENLRRYKAMPLEELIDRSINETLSRTIMTSFTTLLALLALYIFGGEVIRSFTFAMIFGIFVGTYSSIYIAAPILIWFNLRAGVTREEGAAAAARP